MHTKAANTPAVANGAKHFGPSSVDVAVNPMHTTELTTAEVQLPNRQHKRHQIKRSSHHNAGGIDEGTDPAKMRLRHFATGCIPHILVLELGKAMFLSALRLSTSCKKHLRPSKTSAHTKSHRRTRPRARMTLLRVIGGMPKCNFSWVGMCWILNQILLATAVMHILDQGWFQGLPIVGPLYGKLPILVPYL